MSIPDSIISHLGSKGYLISKQTFVAGGDINYAQKVETEDGKVYFVKYNNSPSAEAIISSEIKGLQLLAHHAVNVPQVYAYHHQQEYAYVLMEWVAPGLRDNHTLAQALVKIHKITAENFGLDHDNYIGTLPQRNTNYHNFSEYYISTSIEPQVRLSYDLGLRLQVNLDLFQQVLSDLIPIEQPALLHGDLWSGNLIDSEKGPIFIDPSVSYGHREMDLAMMRLFGGFDNEVFGMYNELFPLHKNWTSRADLFQLYYLLVHLNIFGRQYLGSVKQILEKYLL